MCLATIYKAGSYLRNGSALQSSATDLGLRLFRAQATFRAVFLRALAFQAAQPLLLRSQHPSSPVLAELLALFFEALEGTQAAESAGSRFSLQARLPFSVTPGPVSLSLASSGHIDSLSGEFGHAQIPGPSAYAPQECFGCSQNPPLWVLLECFPMFFLCVRGGKGGGTTLSSFNSKSRCSAY